MDPAKSSPKKGVKSWIPRPTLKAATLAALAKKPPSEPVAVGPKTPQSRTSGTDAQAVPKVRQHQGLGYAALARKARQTAAEKAKTLEAKALKGKKTTSEAPVPIAPASVEEPPTGEPATDDLASIEEPPTGELVTSDLASIEELASLVDPSTGEPAIDDPASIEELASLVDPSTGEPATDDPASIEEPVVSQHASGELAIDDPASAEVPFTGKPASVDSASVEEPVVTPPASGEFATDDPASAEDPSTGEPATDDRASVEDLSTGEPATDDPASVEDLSTGEPATDDLASDEDPTTGELPSDLIDSACVQKSGANLGSRHGTTWIQNPDGTLCIPSRRVIEEAIIRASNLGVSRGKSDVLEEAEASPSSNALDVTPSGDSGRKVKASQSWTPLLEEVFPQRKKLNVIVSKCAPLVEKENGSFCSYLIIENRCACPVAFRVYPGTNVDKRYQLEPGCGCLATGEKKEIRITASSDLVLSLEKVKSDLFVAEIIPVAAIYYFPVTIEWLFEAKRYAIQDLLTINSYFLKPFFISNASITSMVQELSPESTERIAASVSTAKLENLNAGELGFLKKILRYFYNDDTVDRGNYMALITPMVKFVLFSILAYLAFYYGFKFTVQ